MSGEENFIVADALREALNGPKKPVLLDVRSRDEFASGHINGAINIPADELDARAHELPADTTIVTVCNLGGARSRAAVRRLHELGHAGARPLRGGMRGWQDGEYADKADSTSIYLDYNASTPVDPRVTAVMRGLLDEPFGNPSSAHWAGSPAKAILDRARCQVAALLGAAPEEIVFTSGGSEANNLALKGSFFALRNKGGHIVTQATEHPAVLQPLRFLETLGAKVTYLPVDKAGRVSPDAVRHAITAETILISIMHANNETGTVQPVEAVGAIAREHGVRLHTDAAQSAGKITTHVDDLRVDLLSIAGHKLYAPKGVGALYVRSGTGLEPLIHGAGHEHGLRAGTESVMLTAALGEASTLAADLEPMTRIRELRDYFWEQLESLYGDRVVLNGHALQRLPNTLNVSFVGQIGAELLLRLEGVAASTGSACHSGRVELSPVLAGMGISEEVGMGAVRFSLGRGTTRTQIDAVMAQLRAEPFAEHSRRSI